MDLTKIIREQEAAAAERKAAEAKALEEKKAAEAQLHKIHTEQIKELLHTVVRVVFDEGSKQLQDLGYICEITESYSSDAYRKIKEVSMEVELYFEGKKRLPPDGRKTAYSLQFVGDVEAFTISITADFNSVLMRPMNGRNIAVSTVDSALVERHMEWFVTEAIKQETA